MQDDLVRFARTLSDNESAYDVELSAAAMAKLGTYYSLLIRWNERLHLVAPCSPEEFATRHVLESLLLIKHLPANTKIADIGSGAGLPIVPCLIARPDLDATLIESSKKKCVFLREALKVVSRSASIIAKRFEEIKAPDVSFVTSRALDQFIRQIPALLDWAPDGATLLFFGGDELRKELKPDQEFLIPGSERRYLFGREKKRV
jgi:16S rRNA (guanine527-N7)-methyltransferase